MQIKSALAALSVVLAASAWPADAFCAEPVFAGAQWSPSWMASAEPAWPSDFVVGTGMPAAFDHETLRQSARLSVGGDDIRVTLSNQYSTLPLHIGAASVGLSPDGAAAATPRPLTFGGHAETVIPAGASATSDPVGLAVPPLGRVAVSIFLDRPSTLAGLHSAALETVRVAPGNRTGDGALPPGANALAGRAYLESISVLSHRAPRTVAALGDSITDGVGSTPDADRRWPDALADELAGHGIGVLNAGIAGARLLRDGMGTSALERIDRDVFAQPGLDTVVVLLGTNDIGWPGGPFAPHDAPVMAREFIDGYEQLIAKARVHGVRVVGVTVPPFKDALKGTPLEGHYSEAKDRTRRAVNEWIRTSAAFDAVADADGALRDPSNHARLAAAFDSGDHLHPGDAGYRTIARLVAASLERLPGHPSRP